MKTKKKSNPPRPWRTSGHASLVAWVARALSRAARATRALGRVARAPGRTTQATRAPGRAVRAPGRAAQAPGHATQAMRDLGLARAWPRDSGRKGPCDVGRTTWAARALSLSLSDMVSLSLIWSPSLWSDSFSLSDLIRSDEVRLRLRLKVF